MSEPPGLVSPSPGFLELVYGIFANPRSTLRTLTHSRRIGWSLGAFYLATIFNLLINLALNQTSVDFASLLGISSEAGLAVQAHLGYMIAVFSLAGGFLFWFTSASVLGLMAELFGGKGSVLGLWVGMGFVALPSVIGTIADLIIGLAGAPLALAAIISVAVAIWMLILTVYAVQEAYALPGGTALAIVILPLIVLVVATILMAAAMAATMAPFMRGMLEVMPPLP